jgi:hypothetical protein
MNVARLNFAHGEFASHAETIATIRATAGALGERVAILADLPGPKLRIGPLADSPVELHRDQPFTLSVGDFTGDASRASTSFAGLPQAVKPGDLIFLSDGLVQLRVERVDGGDVHCVVAAGGALFSNKGINLPDLASPSCRARRMSRRSAPRHGLRAASRRCSPRSSARPRSRGSTRSSMRPTASWSRAAISASRSRSSASRSCRRS